MKKLAICFTLIFTAVTLCTLAQTPARAAPMKVILDTDIGDDVDDAYALALLLKSPDVQLLGITTAFGDTQLRARLVSTLLRTTGSEEIPVYAGPKTSAANGFTQTEAALKAPNQTYPDAIPFILKSIRDNPGQITLVAIAPLSNIGALLKIDPATFCKLKRVVMMGGSIHRGYRDTSGGHPEPEWNIMGDIPAAQALFQSGVPLYVMPLDSTQIDLSSKRQSDLFDQKTPLTDELLELTREWRHSTKRADPILFDAMTAAYILRPGLCPTTPLHIEVDDKGMTRQIPGTPNANVCLASSADRFFDFYLPVVMR